MGQCCKKIGGTQQQDVELQPRTTKQTVLIQKQELAVHQRTRHDKQFTYFLGVFELLSLGEKLEQPEFIDELHPNFSYENFNRVYHQYQKKIIELGKYIEEYRNKQSPLKKRLAADLLKICQLRKTVKANNDFGCLIKLELQDVRWDNASEIGITLVHPLNWTGKYQQWYKREIIETGPVFLEFATPEIRGAQVIISARPHKAEIIFNLEECFSNAQQLFCKIMKWKGASASEGLALRMQLMSENQAEEKQKFEEMEGLLQKLMREYGTGGEIQLSMSQRETIQRLSRHRSSLNKNYNLSKNMML